MPKNLLQDLRLRTPAEGKSVEPRREIPKPEPVLAETKTETEFASVNDYPGETPPGARSKYGLWIVALGSVAFLLFALSFLFTKAKITLNPKSLDINLSEIFQAEKDASAEAGLPFDLVVLEGTESKTVEAGEEKEVAMAATGRVIIYNAYSAAPQPLAIETRLEGSNGKIYKTDTKLTVPGMKDDTPGQIEVGVYAAEPGEASNSGPLDFKIFGFKGTPKYEKFYARSKGDMTGGLVGRTRLVDPEDKARTEAELKVGLESKLFKKATDQLPAGFILFKGASNLEVSDIQTSTEGGVTTLSLKGTLSGFLFEEKKLAKKIAEVVVPGYDGAEVGIPNLANLIFRLSPLAASFAEAKNISFFLSGPAKIVWQLDAGKLAGELAGKKKKDFNQILSAYPVASGELVLRPFWKTSFPEKSADIQVVVNYPK